MHITILGPDLNRSYENFTPIELNSKKFIRFGLSAIKGVGDQVAKYIISEREKNGLFESFEDLTFRLNSKIINKRILELLIKSGACDSYCNSNRQILLLSLDKTIKTVSILKKDKNSGQISLFSNTFNISLSSKNIISNNCNYNLNEEEKLHLEEERNLEHKALMEAAARVELEKREAQTRLDNKKENLMKQKKEISELALRAEEVRKARIETSEQEKEAEIAFIKSILKGEAGVKYQLLKIKKSCCSSEEYEVAIHALHTVYSQITAHPEQAKFRQIRRDRPKFQEDISRHSGGLELLIATGFRFKTIDEIPCFYLEEPNIEKDMDGWDAWFTLLNRTVELIKESN